ncbi:membrane transport protein-domain-containing protein [Mycena rebaudengoi]|nr:membrane transport protein-domain-containing protein [Mycena rebaudengoi]
MVALRAAAGKGRERGADNSGCEENPPEGTTKRATGAELTLPHNGKTNREEEGGRRKEAMVVRSYLASRLSRIILQSIVIGMSSGLLEGIVSSGKASISVILVLVYGYNISRLGTKFFLPALLFSEIGPLATADNLRNYWPIIPLSLLFQSVALAVGLLSHLAGMPRHYVPIFIFNNVTSLPLLLINSLAVTGALDPLVLPGQTLDGVVKTGRVYILINALVGNLMRFALGPYLMKTHDSKNWFSSYHDDTHDSEELLPERGQIALTDEPTDLPSHRQRVVNALKSVKDWIVLALNPPLIGGLLALSFGLIPWFHRELFGSGILSPISDSVNNIGKLFSALQMLVLGAHLYSKKGAKTNPLHLIWLFLYRFAIAPAISISVIYALRMRYPNLIVRLPSTHTSALIHAHRTKTPCSILYLLCRTSGHRH